MGISKQSKGGSERAKRLTSETRREIAQRAAKARWEKISDPSRLPTATHQGPLMIGDVAVEAYRLDDGRRMISKLAMGRALKLQSKGGNAFLRSMTRPGIRSSISPTLWHTIDNPQRFHRPPKDSGIKGIVVDGYEGTTLIDVCFGLLEAKKTGSLLPSQEFLSVQAEIIIRSAAKLGIIALTDEAVGFEDKAKDEYRRKFQGNYPALFRGVAVTLQWSAEWC